jgi:Fe-S oxidoreductase
MGTQVEIVVTACPSCLQMLEEGIKKKTWTGIG